MAMVFLNDGLESMKYDVLQKIICRQLLTFVRPYQVGKVIGSAVGDDATLLEKETIQTIVAALYIAFV